MKLENTPAGMEKTSDAVKLEDDEMGMISGGSCGCYDEADSGGTIQTRLDPLDPMEHAKEVKGGLRRAVTGKHSTFSQADQNASMF